MSKGWNYDSGQWWILCDVCSKKIKSSEAKHRWDGFIVCPDDYETRHPQDFIRARADKIAVPYMRPRPAVDPSTGISYYNQYVATDYFADIYIADIIL